VPIDAVYTWVNGSDPRRVEELRVVLEKLNQKISTGRDDVRISSPRPQFKCSFKNCVPSEFLVISPAVPTHFDPTELSLAWPGAREAVDWKVTSVKESNSSIFRFPSVDAAERVSESLDLFIVDGEERSVHRGYWTSGKQLNYLLCLPFISVSNRYTKI
jgi:hypothetical protein